MPMTTPDTASNRSILIDRLRGALLQDMADAMLPA